jgi:hypothetical protein
MPRFTETHGRTPRPSPSTLGKQPLNEEQLALADMLLAHVGGIVEELLYQRLGKEGYGAIADDVPTYKEAWTKHFTKVIDPDEPEQRPKNLDELRKRLWATQKDVFEDISNSLDVKYDASVMESPEGITDDASVMESLEEQTTLLRNLHLDLCRTFIEAVGSKRDVAPATESRGRQ